MFFPLLTSTGYMARAQSYFIFRRCVLKNCTICVEWDEYIGYDMWVNMRLRCILTKNITIHFTNICALGYDYPSCLSGS